MTDAALVADAITASGWAPTVVEGEAPGVDPLARRWAEARGIPVEPHPAGWDRYGQSAGPRWNGEMARAGEALVAVWDGGTSDSTKYMVRQARAVGLPVYLRSVGGRESTTAGGGGREERVRADGPEAAEPAAL